MPKGSLESPRELLCAICMMPFTATHPAAKYCRPECARTGARATWRGYRVRNAEDRRTYSKALYAKDPERRKEQIRAYRQTPAGKRAVARAGKLQREKYPQKSKAHRIVYAAIKKGTLVRKPCQRCGSTTRVQAHHHDYSLPLDVHWLCEPCHNLEHHPQDTFVRQERP